VCVAWLLSISAFAPVGSAQQSGQSQPGSRATPDVQTHASGPSDQQVSVAFKDGQLSVRVQNGSLERLTDDISRQAQIPIVLSENVGSQSASVNFQKLPLDKGLRRILARYDAFFFYGVDEHDSSSLKAVWVYPKGQGRGIAPAPPEKWASTKEFEAMLDDKDPTVRGKAIETLVERKGEEALDAVLRSLQDDDDQVRRQALYGAVTVGMRVPGDVLNNLVLTDPSADVRFLALQGLSNSNSPDARQIAQHALNDPSEPVRLEAREIITRLDEEANQSQQQTPSSADQQQPNQPPQNL